MTLANCFTDQIGVRIALARRRQSGLERNPNDHVSTESLEVIEKKQNRLEFRERSKFID